VANDVVIQNCESHHNRTGGAGDGDGFDFDGGTTNSIMQYNYNHDNDGAGYLICSYPNAPHRYKKNTLRYNISVNDCQKGDYGAISVWTGGAGEEGIYETKIYSNTVYSAAGPAISFGGLRQEIHDTRISNNLFITANKRALVQGEPDRSMATFVGNAYWSIDCPLNISGHQSLEEWREATGQEILDGKPTGLIVDPRMMDPRKSAIFGNPLNLQTSTAYHLRKDSPLIDAGLDLRTLFGIDPGKRDFWGNPIPQGKGYDIGAHEVVAKDISCSGQE
jgi:hypothetical protein